MASVKDNSAFDLKVFFKNVNRVLEPSTQTWPYQTTTLKCSFATLIASIVSTASLHITNCSSSSTYSTSQIETGFLHCVNGKRKQCPESLPGCGETKPRARVTPTIVQRTVWKRHQGRNTLHTTVFRKIVCNPVTSSAPSSHVRRMFQSPAL